MFLLDTNSLIYFFKGEGEVGRRLLATPPSSIALPTVVLYELETGLAKSSDTARRRRQLDSLLEVVTVLPFGLAEARAAAQIRAGLEAAGTPIGPIDTLIAGVARASGSVLVTRNTREFGRVPGLVVENWYEPP
jgi:tRNA(fMet)-specific endonuclease VapC